MSEQPISLLIVDDDETILETAADYFRMIGYEVMTAGNGNEGFFQMQQQTPNVVISDIMMPEADGYQFYERVRENPQWTTVPFIFLTARGQRQDVRLGYTLGVDDYLIKPFELKDLQMAVESRLKRVRAIQVVSQNDAEQMKQQLLTTFGHELRTPLTQIYGYLSLLKEDHSQLSDDEVDEMLSGMDRGAKRLIRLVEDLMLLIRIDSGAANVEIERHRIQEDVNVLISQVVALNSVKAEARHVQITVDVPYGLEIFCLPGYLQDALARLVDNGIKFSKMQGGHLHISAEGQDNSVVIRIADDGLGIHPDERKQLFQRFQQIDRAHREQQGLGLGLVIADAIVKLHGGTITLQSEASQGSAFTVTLPTR